MGQDAAFEEDVELVLDELRRVGAGCVFGMGEKGRGVLLHRTVQRGLLGAVALVVERSAIPARARGLKELNVAVSSAPWLSPLRNGMGFHFPTFDRWSSHVVPDESWVDDIIFLGDKSGNTYYDAADTVAQAWMFEQYGAVELRNAVDPLIGQTIDLLRLMNSFLEDALGVFVAEVILEGRASREHVGKVLAPEFERVSIPFWTAMPPRRT